MKREPKPKITKDTLPEDFTLLLALTDSLPVIFFGASMLLIGRRFSSPLFMAGAVLATQDRQGHWHASLLDPDSYPDPENSASAFFCYGLGWGLRTGLLKGEEYEKALLRGWAALVEAVHPDGLLGYIQPVGADPRPAGPDSTDVYGVGAFLLAGSEMLRLYGN